MTPHEYIDKVLLPTKMGRALMQPHEIRLAEEGRLPVEDAAAVYRRAIMAIGIAGPENWEKVLDKV